MHANDVPRNLSHFRNLRRRAGTPKLRFPARGQKCPSDGKGLTASAVDESCCRRLSGSVKDCFALLPAGSQGRVAIGRVGLFEVAEVTSDMSFT